MSSSQTEGCVGAVGVKTFNSETDMKIPIIDILFGKVKFSCSHHLKLYSDQFSEHQIIDANMEFRSARENTELLKYKEDLKKLPAPVLSFYMDTFIKPNICYPLGKSGPLDSVASSDFSKVIHGETGPLPSQIIEPTITCGCEGAKGI